MMAQTQTSSNNNFSQTPLTTPNCEYTRHWLPKHEFDSANEQKRIWVKAVTAECNLTGNEPAVLEIVAFNTSAVTGEGVPSIGTIQEELLTKKGIKLHWETVRRTVSRIVSKGGLTSQPRYSNKKGKYKESNLLKLVGYEYKLENHSYDVLDNLNSSILGDHKNNITYDEYVSISTNLEKKEEKKTRKPFTPKNEKHIDNVKLKTEPEKEIKRAVQAYGVDETHIPEIAKVMRERLNTDNPAKYLVGILNNKLKENPSLITYGQPKETDQQRVARYARERECLPADHPKSDQPKQVKEFFEQFKRAH